MNGKRFYINCNSRYFTTKYGDKPIITIEGKAFLEYTPPAFLYQGRVLAEGRTDLLKPPIYYGHVEGLGEFIHGKELGEEVE